MTIYSLDILLSQFGTSLLFHIQFCCFLTCIQISQEAGQMVWYTHLLKNFPQFVVIYTIPWTGLPWSLTGYSPWGRKSQTQWLNHHHTVKGFGIVNKAEIHVFLELSCFFHDSVDVGNLISGSSAFSKYSLNLWKYMVQVLLKPGLENYEHYFASRRLQLCNSSNILWHCLSLGLEWKLTFFSPVATAEFSNLLAYWVQHFHSITF